jgi:hypothetical protein
LTDPGIYIDPCRTAPLLIGFGAGRLTDLVEPIRLVCMRQRLQVLLDEEELAEIRRIAGRHRMTVAEWVRQALRAARRNEPAEEAKRKLAAVRQAARGCYPIVDIGTMLSDIERGYATGLDQEGRLERFS